MPSTPTTSLRLEKQAQGEHLNTWGAGNGVGLNNVLDMLDAAIAGTAAIVVTGNFALSSANYTADQARNAVLALSGTPTGPFTVTTPSVSKIYYVRNTTGQPATFSCGAGTATVPSGQTWVLFCDGVNWAGVVLPATLDQNVPPLVPVDFGGQRAVNAANPTSPQDLCTKAYADALAFGATAGILPGQGGNTGKVIATNGAAASWVDPGALVWCGTAGGSANALAVSLPVAQAVAGTEIEFVAAATSTAAVTLNGAPLTNATGEPSPALMTGQRYSARYDGANWRLSDTAVTAFANGSAPITGATRTFQLSDRGKIVRRSNSNVAMTDTFSVAPPAGWFTKVVNSDAAAILSVAASAGFYVNGGSSVPVAPGGEVVVASDGTNLWVYGNSGYGVTPTVGDNSLRVPTTAFVAAAVSPLAPKDSPAFTGTPAAPTPPSRDSSTKIATTAFARGIGNVYASFISFTVNTTITLAQLNSFSGINASGLTITLPDPATARSGDTFTILPSVYGCTVATTGSALVIVTPLSSVVSSFPLLPGDGCQFICSGSGWLVAQDSSYKQSWHNVTPSRFWNTNYTNTHSKAMKICVITSNQGSTGDADTVFALVDGFVIAKDLRQTLTTGGSCLVYFEVPPGSTYQVQNGGSVVLDTWSELY